MKNKFLRSDTVRHLRLGKNRRKLQKWRRPRGRHSKIRKKRMGYPVFPTVGYKGQKKKSGKISNLAPLVVYNVSGVEKASQDNILIIARVGAKKKMDIIKKAEEKNLKIFNAGGAK